MSKVASSNKPSSHAVWNSSLLQNSCNVSVPSSFLRIIGVAAKSIILSASISSSGVNSTSSPVTSSTSSRSSGVTSSDKSTSSSFTTGTGISSSVTISSVGVSIGSSITDSTLEIFSLAIANEKSLAVYST